MLTKRDDQGRASGPTKSRMRQDGRLPPYTGAQRWKRGRRTNYPPSTHSLPETPLQATRCTGMLPRWMSECLPPNHIWVSQRQPTGSGLCLEWALSHQRGWVGFRPLAALAGIREVLSQRDTSMDSSMGKRSGSAAYVFGVYFHVCMNYLVGWLGRLEYCGRFRKLASLPI